MRPIRKGNRSPFLSLETFLICFDILNKMDVK
nr:MAG TPA: hypothetical protein [Caudoviricetes sp.]